MLSPFYISEQKMLYPYRKYMNNENDVYLHICFLVDNRIKTIEQLRAMSFVILKREYFTNVSNEDLYNGFYNYFVKNKK